MRSRLALALAASLATSMVALGAAPPREARAETVWARARRPDDARRAEALAEAERHLEKYARTRRPSGFLLRDTAEQHLRAAEQVLKAAGAAGARDVALRFRLAQVLFRLDQWAEAVPHLEWVLRSSASAPTRSEAWRMVAIAYARLDRHDDEIRAYGEALALEPHAQSRAILLGNRAEAYMLKGDLTLAIEGYRASLALLTQGEMGSGVTTLWGLAVALDRSGDLQKAIETIDLARSYDERDRAINDKDSWFFVPPYDEHWYGALGHWARARKADLGAVRAEHYGRAVSAWEDFIASAAPTDPWLPIARARLKACEKERDEALRRARARAKRRPAPGLEGAQGVKPKHSL